MDRIQKPDTAYQDDSQSSTSLTPQFNVRTARRARQVVALPSNFTRQIHRLWASLGSATYRAKLLAGIVLVALAGGVSGVFLAAANKDRTIDDGSLTVGAEAKSQTDDPPQPTSSAKEPKRISRPSDPGPQAEFDRPEMERLVVELGKRQSPSRQKKAYRVATIYPRDLGDYNDSHRGRKHGKKH